LGKTVNTAQTASGWAGVGNLGGWALGTPYATSALWAPIVAPAVTNHFIGKPMAALAEKRKAVDEFLGSETAKPVMNAVQQFFAKNFPDVQVFDNDGLPSVEALQIAKQYGLQGLGGLSSMGNTIFADKGYFFDPSNWDRLNHTDKVLYDIVNGRYRQGGRYASQLAAAMNRLIHKQPN
jgi:hypothetical protein